MPDNTNHPDLPADGDPDDFDEVPVADDEFDPEPRPEPEDEPNDLSGIDREFNDDEEG